MARIGIVEIIVLCALVMVLPIWFAWRARPLGQHPYRWGTWIAIHSALAAVVIGFFAVPATIARGIDIPIAAYWLSGITSLGGAVGLFHRIRVGAVLTIVSEILIIMLDPVTRVFYGVNEAVTPGSGLPILGLVVINVFYFRRRWTAMGRRVDLGTAESI